MGVLVGVLMKSSWQDHGKMWHIWAATGCKFEVKEMLPKCWKRPGGSHAKQWQVNSENSAEVQLKISSKCTKANERKFSMRLTRFVQKKLYPHSSQNWDAA